MPYPVLEPPRRGASPEVKIGGEVMPEGGQDEAPGLTNGGEATVAADSQGGVERTPAEGGPEPMLE